MNQPRPKTLVLSSSVLTILPYTGFKTLRLDATRVTEELKQSRALDSLDCPTFSGLDKNGRIYLHVEVEGKD